MTGEPDDPGWCDRSRHDGRRRVSARRAGRGATINPAGRYERLEVVREPDTDDEAGPDPPTILLRDTSRSVISRNDSPDVPFEVSLNPYRGCEHGCVYCYARPTHEYLGFSAGLDFETRLLVKEDAAALLREELSRPGWRPQPLALSGVTDPYQPVERTLGITRQCLAVLAAARHPVSVITKAALVTRDSDLLAELASHDAVHVGISVTTLDETLRRAMEPRAPTAERRLEAIARLNALGVPCGVVIAPVIPGLTDHEIPALLARAAEAGARFASFTMLRLPHGVKDIFAAWLHERLPDRARKVLSRVRDVRGGRLYDNAFGTRMRGTGPSADLVARLFHRSRERVGIPAGPPALSAGGFRRPGSQARLFE